GSTSCGSDGYQPATTSAPASARTRAVAAPMPEAAPVTSATRPSSRNGALTATAARRRRPPARPGRRRASYSSCSEPPGPRPSLLSLPSCRGNLCEHLIGDLEHARHVFLRVGCRREARVRRRQVDAAEQQSERERPRL